MSDEAGALSPIHPDAGAVSIAKDPEFLLADEMRMKAFKAGARKRKAAMELKKQDAQPATQSDLLEAMAAARKSIDDAASEGNLACIVVIPKAACRADVATKLAFEGMDVRDDEWGQRLHIQWVS